MATIAVSIILTLLSSGLMFRAYKRKRMREYLQLSSAFVILALWISTMYFVQGTLPDERNEIIVSLFVYAGIIWISTFVVVFLISIRGLTGKHSTVTDQLGIGYLAFVTGISIISLNIVRGDRYNIIYTPTWTLSVYGSGVILIIFKIILIIAKEQDSRRQSNNYVPVIIGFAILGVGVLTAVIERTQSGSTFYYFIFIALGLLSISIGLMKDPFQTLSNTPNIRYMVVSDRETGAFIYERSFSKEIDVSLFSAGMRAILDVMDDMLDEIPHTLAFLDGIMLIIKSERFVMYAVSTVRTSELVKRCERFLQDIESYNWRGDIITEEFVNFMDEHATHI